jgi:ribose transport system substrate-binding protein
MNRLLRFLTPLLAAVFIVLLILTVKYMLSNRFVADSTSSGERRSNHFAFFLPEADYSFFEALKNGAIDAAEVMDGAISFHPIDKDLLSLEMARYTGIDGIAVYPYRESGDLSSAVQRIYESGIPVVQIENQLPNMPESVFIGTNSFDFGKAIGRLSLKSKTEDLNIALVYSDKNPGFLSYESLLEMGMKSILGRRVALFRSFKTSQNSLDAEKLAYELIKSEDDFNLIVFTDTNDTLVSVQAIIDMNLVGSVQIIGFGSDPAINAFIDKGIVLGSIVRDPYHIGYNAVLALTEKKENGYTSAYVDAGISIIDKDTPPARIQGGAD